jgi:hypothetical protein
VKRFFLIITLGWVLLGAACTNVYTPTPGIPTQTLPPLATFTPRYTATPVPTSSPRPTFTMTPSVTPIPPTASNTPTPTPTPPVIGRVSTVQDAINLREGPAVTFPAIQGLLNNTDLIVLAANEDQSWYNVRLEDGTEGWVAANLIYLVPTTTPEPTNTVPGVVVQVSGTPLATSLLGGLPVTATPSFTPTTGGQNLSQTFIPTLRTPGTVTPTLTVTATDVPAASIPTVTPLPENSPTTEADLIPTVATAVPTVSGTVIGPRAGYDVLAYCDQYERVPPPLAEGTTVDVFWGWEASTRDYVQQHIASVIYEVEIDGMLLDSWRQYADEIQQEPNGVWSIYWYVPVDIPLEPGLHTISYRVSWRNPIFDGSREFGPGTETEFEVGSCTFEIR